VLVGPLAALIVHAATHTPVVLRVGERCRDDLRAGVARVLGVELGVRVLAIDDDEAGPAIHVNLRCTAHVVHIEVRPFPGVPADERLVNLKGLNPAGEERLVGIAVSEMVAPWGDDFPPEPEGTSPTAPVKASRLNTTVRALARASLSPRVAMTYGALAAADFHAGGSPLVWAFDAGVEQGTEHFSLGEIRSRAVTSLAALGFSADLGSMSWLAGAGARFGYLELAANPTSEATDADTVSGPWAGPAALCLVHWTVGELVLTAGAEFGYTMLSVVGRIDGEVAAGRNGMWLTATVGAGLVYE
jgi:hypothetical protein